MAKRRRHSPISKAAPRGTVQPAATFTAEQVQALLRNQQIANTGQLAVPLPRLEPMVPFGPGIPIQTGPIDPLNPATGRPEPRITEYPVSINLPGMTDRLVPWKTLRDAAEIPVVRDCIRIRKNEVTTLDWDIVISKRALQQYKKRDPDTSSVKIQRELRDRLDPEVGRLIQFWQRPDPVQGECFVDWATKALEEHLVLDAVAIYPYRNRGGDRMGFRVLDGSCYSADTEVLTEAGWKTFDMVDLATDRFATRNQKTRRFEWQQATYFHEADWDSDRDGQCYAVTSRTLDLLVTPNHRMLVNSLPMALGGNSHRKGDVFVTAEDLYKHASASQAIPATSNWEADDLHQFELVANGHANSMGVSFSGDDFAAFMGMYLAEGCYTGGDQVAITQLPSSKGFVPFRQLLARIFGRNVCHTGKSFVVGRRVLHDYLKQFGKAHEKHVPAIVKNMSRRQLGIFWEYYRLGDGYTDGNRQCIVTSSPHMADDLQEIAQKLGYSASLSVSLPRRDIAMTGGRVIRKENQRPKYVIRLRTSRYQHFAMTPVAYTGKVYCVSVPNEVLYVRRSGKPAWCGNTIKPMLDHLGGRPMPPNPAYQQILWGFPRGEYTVDNVGAEFDDDGGIVNPYDSDRLIYKRREVRTITPYGFSAVEQSLQDVDLYLRRLEWDKAQYTDGVQPAGWIKNTGMESWTPQQMADYNRAFNDFFAGQTLNRMRYHLLPPGMEPMESADIAEKYKPDYHLHLVRLVAMHFDVTMAELGFTEAKGLGSAGYHEGEENVQARKATNPTLKWLQSVLTEISRTHLGMPWELEFKFLGLDTEDEAAADDVIDKQLKSARITWNEAREEMGRPPYDFPEADMPVVQTTRGLIFVENASQLVEPGEEVTPPQAPPLKAPPEGSDADPVDTEDQPAQQDSVPPVVQERQSEQAAKEQGKKPASAGAPAKATKAVVGDEAKAELAAYWKWARNGRDKRRPFEFAHLSRTQAMLHEIDLDTVVFKAGGAGPKAAGRHWPAWEKDQQVAAYWATELRAALSGVPTRTIASRWLELRKAADPQRDDRRRDAEQWLIAIGWSLSALVRRVLLGLYVDAYLLGDKSAQALLADEQRIAWGEWKPGSTAETRLLIAADGMDPGLQHLLVDAGRIAEGINSTRVRDVAKALADAVDDQPTVDELEAEIQAVLDDEAMAQRIGITETSRGMNDAALKRYDLARLDGVTGVYWLTAEDERVCIRCGDNEDAGAIPIGQVFPSGASSPPDHTSCRCALVPAYVSFSDLNS